jgi:two-component system response regulator HydG
MPQPFSVLVRPSGETQAVCPLTTSFAFRRHPVVVTGENGTGRELCARAIHAEGPRRDRPFVPLDCGAPTPTLIESQLVGIEGSLF